MSVTNLLVNKVNGNPLFVEAVGLVVIGIYCVVIFNPPIGMLIPDYSISTIKDYRNGYSIFFSANKINDYQQSITSYELLKIIAYKYGTFTQKPIYMQMCEKFEL